MDKNHKDLVMIDLNNPRHAQCMSSSMEETSIVLWRKDWSSIRLDRTLSLFIKHSQFVLSRKLFGWKLEKLKVFIVTSASTKDLFETRIDARIGFRSCSTTGGPVLEQSESSQSSQPSPNPDHHRTGPVVCPQRGALMDICQLIYGKLDAKHQKYKGRVVHRGDIVNKILDFMQYSLNKDHQHHKWRQQKSWISHPDCQGAQDKQRMKFLLIPNWKWKMLTHCWKFQSRSVQTFGFVYHDTNGQNHDPVWKTQSFLLSGICMVILWQDYCGKGNWRKSC